MKTKLSKTSLLFIVILLAFSPMAFAAEQDQNSKLIKELSEKVADLEKRLTNEEDISAIKKLKQRYVSFADQKYLHGKANSPEIVKAAAKAFSELFVEDGTWGGGAAGAIAKGRDEIYEHLAGIHQPWIQHYMMSPEIRINGDKAYGRWYVLNLAIDPEGNSVIISGYEDDVYVKINGKWFFKDMLWSDVMFAPLKKGWSYPDSFPKNGNPWKNMPFK